MIYNDGDYRIVERRKDYILANCNGNYDNHGHLKCEGDCHDLIELINKRQVPDKYYDRVAAIRISTDDKYIEKIKHKIEKDKNKQRYRNVNKSIR